MKATDKIDAIKQRDDELNAAREAQRKSLESEAALKREIEQLLSFAFAEVLDELVRTFAPARDHLSAVAARRAPAATCSSS